MSAVESGLMGLDEAAALIRAGHFLMIAGDEALLRRLMPAGYAARPEQALLFTVTAWDVNCPQHIPVCFEAEDVRRALRRLRRDQLDVFLVFWTRSAARLEGEVERAIERLIADLRAMGETTGGPKPMSARDRSRFLSALDEAIQRLKRRGAAGG